MAGSPRKKRDDGNGLPLTSEVYLVTFADGTRGKIFKVGQRWHAKFPKGVKIVPSAGRIKRRRTT